MMLMEPRAAEVERAGCRVQPPPLAQPLAGDAGRAASPALAGERGFPGAAEALLRSQHSSGAQPRLERTAGGALVVETAESEACTGRAFGGSQGAVEVLSGLGGDQHTSFTGIFRAPQPGAARALLQQLVARLQECAGEQPAGEGLLAAAVCRCQAQLASCSGLSGCLALVSGGALSYWSTGNASLALGERQGSEVTAVDISDSAARQPVSLSARERLKSLGQVVQQARHAFGSIIPIDRAAVLLGGSPHAPPPARLPLQPAHLFLVMGAALCGAAFEAAGAVADVHRSRQQHPEAGQAAVRLALAGHARLAAAGEADAHVTVAVCHLQAEAAEPAHSSSGQAGEDEVASLSSLQLSPARRVHFLEPLHGSEVALGTSPAAAGQPAWGPLLAEPAPGGFETAASGEGPVPDSSGLISSNSLLSQPEMCIPEEGALPGEHTALQLPPPLLAPIRKAVLAPCHADLQNIPPQANKAKIGRAASLNSPYGLLPLSPPPPPSPPRLPPPGPRLSSLGSLGSLASLASLARTGSGASQGRRASEEEGRVRGGMPRAVSVPSALAAALLTPSPDSPPLAGSLARGDRRRGGRGQAAARLTKLNSAPMPRPASEERLLPLTSSQPPASPEGRKMRGKSSALRVLQASAAAALGPASAPATLEQALGLSLSPADCTLEDLQGACSSATSSCNVSEAEAPRCNPFAPQLLELKPPRPSGGSSSLSMPFARRELDSAGRGGLLPGSGSGPHAAAPLADSVASLTMPGGGGSSSSCGPSSR